MPRRRKGARLQLKAARRDRFGIVTHRAVWIIRDNGRDVSTGCAEDEVAKAEQALRQYIASKYEPKKKAQDIDAIPVADVLLIYLDAELARLRDRFKVIEANEDGIPDIRKFKMRIGRLNDWWGAKTLAEVDGEQCRAYVRDRGNKGGSRRDLEDLRAAIGHHAAEGYHRGLIKVTLPQKGRPRDAWLTRAEAARLIHICRRYREVQTASRGRLKGQPIETGKRPLAHLARFVLIGLYTGSRAGAIAAASPVPAAGRAYVDLERGLYYRLRQGAVETNKRQPTVPLPKRLLAHLRRWQKLSPDAQHFVEFNGRPVSSVKTAFKTAVGFAGITKRVSPHTLRHTAATWLMQRGTDPWQAAGYLGMSLDVLLNTYGHHHPDYLSDAVNKITSRETNAERTKNVSGAVTGAVRKFQDSRGR